MAPFINSTHLLVPSPVRRRSGRLPPRPPGPLQVLELCLPGATSDSGRIGHFAGAAYAFRR